MPQWVAEKGYIMKLVMGLFSLAGIILGMVIGYNIVANVIPEYLPMWWIAQVLMLTGIIGSNFSE